MESYGLTFKLRSSSTGRKITRSARADLCCQLHGREIRASRCPIQLPRLPLVNGACWRSVHPQYIAGSKGAGPSSHQRPDAWRVLERDLVGLGDARRRLTTWVADYNNERPHSSLKYQTPAANAAILTATGDRLCNLDQFANRPSLHAPLRCESTEIRREARKIGETAPAGTSRAHPLPARGQSH
jgi:Integrase core domain